MIGILKIIAVKWSEAKAPNIFNIDAGDQIWLVKGNDKKSEGNVWILISYYSIKNKKNKKKKHTGWGIQAQQWEPETKQADREEGGFVSSKWNQIPAPPLYPTLSHFRCEYPMVKLVRNPQSVRGWCHPNDTLGILMTPICIPLHPTEWMCR